MIDGVERSALSRYLNEYLETERFEDYCPNGLQVEGRREIRCIVSGVTACEALIRAAIDLKADALLVHHGLFWKGDDYRVVGMLKTRLSLLLEHGINLFAYHLPLDVHPEIGNNATLGEALGWRFQCAEGSHGLLHVGEQAESSFSALVSRIQAWAGHPVKAIGAEDLRVKRVAWCTGGAQKMIHLAADHGVDVYVSGEISEATTHVARERGVAYIAAGHHATERGGPRALGEHVARHFQLQHHFVDISNPA